MSKAEQLCDTLHERLSGTHGFECAGEAFGFEDNYLFIEWRTSKDGNNTFEPSEQDSLGTKLNEIGNQFGYQIIYMRARTNGLGDFYFKPLT